ncbi:expressed unknown protein [Seminavis robusta]|uniref:Uncharacterized protein n=1 Tax=Seminavis robusta TaxID=568900 RepID=A0A9N8EXY9_9STRA|nr:expressed unknown protein [Seminavis robusta]|eukprot:Sro2124_g315620.1 n/a (308) ;mRNA; f:16136-17059
MPSQAEEKSNSGSRSDDYGNRTHSQVEPEEDDGQSAIQEVLTRRPELEAKQYDYQTEADFSASILAAIEKEHGVATTNTAASKGYERINEGVQLGGDGTMQTVPGGNTDATGQGEHQKPIEEKPHQLRHDLAFFHAHHLLERAAEGREHVKIERNSRHSGIPGSDAHSSHDIEVQREPTTGGVHGEEQNHQTVDNRTVQNLSRPGAYMAGGPGGALPRRADSARLSLLVADPTDAAPQDDPRNINARSGQLAVANIVYEDPEQHARPSANPVNLQAILQREQQRKKQQKFTAFPFVSTCLAHLVLNQ